MAKHIVLGGTGTLGKAIISQLLYKTEESNIICFSRDELKQSELRKTYPKIKYIIGDIKDEESVSRLFSLHDYTFVYHAAALKQIDTVEVNPEEAVKTNILGTMNCALRAIKHGVKYYAFASTDKAVFPINVYGMTKALSERYLLHLNEIQIETIFSVFRWGNILGSRGSVLDYFVKTIKSGLPINITHPEMSRFWLRIEDAARFMIENTPVRSSAVKIPPMKAMSVLKLAECIAEVLEVKKPKINITGIRKGEKIHEDITDHMNSKTSPQYSKKEMREILKGIIL